MTDTTQRTSLDKAEKVGMAAVDQVVSSYAPQPGIHKRIEAAHVSAKQFLALAQKNLKEIEEIRDLLNDYSRMNALFYNGSR
jgi:hypothetical protein